MAELPPDAIPFFARVLAFDCACPGCGQLVSARGDARDGLRSARPQVLGVRSRRRKDLPWNPFTGRFRCPNCQRVFGTGLLCYEVTGVYAGVAPADHRPDARQRAALRQQTSQGRLMPRPAVRSGDPTNVYAEPGCTCPQPYGWRPSCPIHSWEAFEANHPGSTRT